VPTLKEFGHGSLTIAGKPALGGRKLLVILASYSEHPPIGVTHSNAYYGRLAFGKPVPPFTTDKPVNPASLTELFRENSNERFWLEDAGVIGPLEMGALGADPGPETRLTKIMERVAKVSPRSLIDVDANGSGDVSRVELAVVVIESFLGAQPATRQHHQVWAQIGSGSSSVAVAVNTWIAGCGPLTPFFQIAHELAHVAVGAEEVYRDEAGIQEGRNYLMSLMAGYSFDANNQVPVHFDIWHKLVLGWAEPRVFRLTDPGFEEVWEGADGAILLWDDAHGTNEYFLIERRGPALPGQRYDSGVRGDGVAIWRINRSKGSNGVQNLAPPELEPGGSGIWRPGTQTPYLRWSNGALSGISVSVVDAGTPRLRVRWSEAIKHHNTTCHQTLFHLGPSTNGAGRGVFLGVTSKNEVGVPENKLEWNRYDGKGIAKGQPGSEQDWHPNSKNMIGRGFRHMLHLVGCGDGAFMAVHPNGDLYWYAYDGDGTEENAGSAGWRAGSQNVIGNTWQNFLHVTAIPRLTGPGSWIQVLAVDRAGALHWYEYDGSGQTDREGIKGWGRHSVIAHGWRGIRHMHASGRVIFSIDQQGVMRWHRYDGNGIAHGLPGSEQDWHLNSGKAIGRDWQGMRQVFGSVPPSGTDGHVIMGVDAAGNLRWHRYTGQGQEDIAGSTGWDPRSGAIIDTGW
jgi:Tachylectin